MQAANSFDYLRNNLCRVSLLKERLRHDIIEQFSTTNIFLYNVNALIVLKGLIHFENVRMVHLGQYFDLIDNLCQILLANHVFLDDLDTPLTLSNQVVALLYLAVHRTGQVTNAILLDHLLGILYLAALTCLHDALLSRAAHDASKACTSHHALKRAHGPRRSDHATLTHAVIAAT